MRIVCFHCIVIAEPKTFVQPLNVSAGIELACAPGPALVTSLSSPGTTTNSSPGGCGRYKWDY